MGVTNYLLSGMIFQAIVVIDSGEFASNSEDVLKVFWYRDKFDHITTHFEGGVVV